MSVTKSEIINDMLIDNVFRAGANHQTWKADRPWSFCVHNSIIGNWENILHQFSTKWEIHDYQLNICGERFDMCMINITPKTTENQAYLNETISNSQFSFPWLDNPTLFIEAGSFKILKAFIADHSLDSDVLKIEEKPGITAQSKLIKVVTFNRTANVLSKIKKFPNYLLIASGTYEHSKYYYMTYTFSWLQPLWLKHFEISIVNEQFYSIFYIILIHLGTLDYTNQLNVFDLLMLRLALCDFRNPTLSNSLKCEIDFMVSRKLSKIIINNHLDLVQYTIDENYSQRDILLNYLVYEYQDHFETVNINRRFTFSRAALKENKVRSTIQLIRESDVLDTLRQKCNIQFIIDGHGYDQMNLSLFLNLVECDNVYVIRLDTNYEWIKNAWHLNRSLPNLVGGITVELAGENPNNFAEEFIACLKTITFLNRPISLEIHCNLHDYGVLCDLSVAYLTLYNIKINTRTLNDFRIVNSDIRILNSTFEGTRHTWAQFYDLRKLIFAEIVEDEGIWESLFEFISDELIKSRTKEFQFDSKFFEVVVRQNRLACDNIKFTVDEAKSKLEMRDKNTNEIIDLYYLKYGLEPEDKSVYNYYE